MIKIVPSPKQRAQVLEILHSVADLTSPRIGCLGCCLTEEDSLEKPVRYTEQWESEQTLYAHIRSELYRRLLGALELSKREPEVKFYFASHTKGFELIEALRNSRNTEETTLEQGHDCRGSVDLIAGPKDKAALEHMIKAQEKSH